MKKIVTYSVILFLILTGGSMFFLSNQINGFRAFVVTSASMEPTIPTGSLLITHYQYPHTLQNNDIITFLPPITPTDFVTHRITQVKHDQNLSTFKTKGDNNEAEDTWTLAGGAVVGKVITIIPFLGYFFSFTQSPLGLLLFIIVPAVYIVVDESSKIIALIKQHKKQSHGKQSIEEKND